MKLLSFLSGFFLLFFFLSCTKEIDVGDDLPPFNEKVIIEGYIENDEFPWVFISKNIGFSTRIEYIFLKEAQVIVSDGDLVDTLEYLYDELSLPYKEKFVGCKIKGISGKQYTLTVQYEGKEYKALTTIPAVFKPDSIWFQPEKWNKQYGYLKTVLKKEDSKDHYYFLYSKAPTDYNYSSSFRNLQNSLKFKESTKDWVLYSTIKVEVEPVRPGSGAMMGFDFGICRVGDTIDYKFCSLNKENFDFLESISWSNASPFSEPSKVKSNIEGGALGIWAGYGACVVQLICKPDENLADPME